MNTKGLQKLRQRGRRGPKANERMARAAGELQEEPFVGVMLTSRLQQQLDKCAIVNRHYFERREPQSLQIVSIKGKRVLGRPVKRGATSGSVEDTVRNIRSILLKICPQYNICVSEIKVHGSESVRVAEL